MSWHLQFSSSPHAGDSFLRKRLASAAHNTRSSVCCSVDLQTWDGCDHHPASPAGRPTEISGTRRAGSPRALWDTPRSYRRAWPLPTRPKLIDNRCPPIVKAVISLVNGICGQHCSATCHTDPIKYSQITVEGIRLHAALECRRSQVVIPPCTGSIGEQLHGKAGIVNRRNSQSIHVTSMTTRRTFQLHLRCQQPGHRERHEGSCRQQAAQAEAPRDQGPGWNSDNHRRRDFPSRRCNAIRLVQSIELPSNG